MTQQPAGDQYPLDALYNYPRYTRATYFAVTGQQAAPFQALQPIKRWALPASEMAGHSPTSPFSFRYVDSADGQYKTDVITYQAAGELNLPGVTTYPKYSAAPTGAVAITSTSMGDRSASINPEYLSMLAEAQALASQLNAGQPFEPAQSFGSISYPGTELRRAWAITLTTGEVKNAGMLLKERAKAGVGAPGHWSDPVNPQWIADVATTSEANLLPEIPVPCRELYPDEVIAQVFMGGWLVQRKQLATKLSDQDLMPQRVREIHAAVVGRNPMLVG